MYIYLMYNLFNDNYGLRHLALFRQKSSIQEPEYDVKVRADELSKMKFQLKLTIVGQLGLKWPPPANKLFDKLDPIITNLIKHTS